MYGKLCRHYSFHTCLVTDELSSMLREVEKGSRKGVDTVDDMHRDLMDA